MLLYKQALLLSMPSAIQDSALALEMCERADSIFEKQADSATGLYRALGTLVTPIVSLLQQHTTPDADITGKGTAPSKLRAAILQFRDRVGASPHRDELELGLFASKMLLDHGGESGRYQTLEDANLLLSFCQIGLSPYQNESLRKAYGAMAGSEADARAYLRPYYDAVMRAKMKMSRKSVKDLLEIQREATLGTRYVKSKDVMPVVAMYVLDGDCYLFLDIPGGESKCVSVSELYGLDRIRSATFSNDSLLPLPRGIDEALSNWWRKAEEGNGQYERWKGNYCWWQDPVHGFSEAQIPQGRSQPGKTTVARPAVGRFPFELPAPKPATDASTSR
jgi:hypothetical protein